MSHVCFFLEESPTARLSARRWLDGVVIGLLAVAGFYQITGLKLVTASQLLPLLAYLLLFLAAAVQAEQVFRGMFSRLLGRTLGSWITMLLACAAHWRGPSGDPHTTLVSTLSILLIVQRYVPVKRSKAVSIPSTEAQGFMQPLISNRGAERAREKPASRKRPYSLVGFLQKTRRRCSPLFFAGVFPSTLLWSHSSCADELQRPARLLSGSRQVLERRSGGYSPCTPRCAGRKNIGMEQRVVGGIPSRLHRLHQRMDAFAR